MICKLNIGGISHTTKIDLKCKVDNRISNTVKTDLICKLNIGEIDVKISHTAKLDLICK